MSCPLGRDLGSAFMRVLHQARAMWDTFGSFPEQGCRKSPDEGSLKNLSTMLWSLRLDLVVQALVRIPYTGEAYV